jgi:hypothetical protein
MIDKLIEINEKRSAKLMVACGQLGAYKSMIMYAIDCLNGKTASSSESVAKYLQEKQDELLEQQDSLIFKTHNYEL